MKEMECVFQACICTPMHVRVPMSVCMGRSILYMRVYVRVKACMCLRVCVCVCMFNNTFLCVCVCVAAYM